MPSTISVRNGHVVIPRRGDPSVRIPDAITKCVGFVCAVEHRDSEMYYGDAYATGFFVSVPCESPELRHLSFLYFVSAKHVATDLGDREMFFLVNRVGGGVSDDLRSPDNYWWFHPTDKSADVAVIQVGRNPELDIIPIVTEAFATPEKIAEYGIGIGDETNVVGLFTPAPGVEQTMPIVRHGNICMMPKEQIQTAMGYADVFLVEARSLGGLSGSPVFVRHTISAKVKTTKGEQWSFSLGHGETLLGLMHGHWDIRESEMNKPYFTHDSEHGVNYGVAIVVPAQKIYETLYRPELVKIRKKHEESELKKNVPTMDSSKKKERSEFTRDDFESALKKTSRKI